MTAPSFSPSLHSPSAGLTFSTQRAESCGEVFPKSTAGAFMRVSDASSFIVPALPVYARGTMGSEQECPSRVVN